MEKFICRTHGGQVFQLAIQPVFNVTAWENAKHPSPELVEAAFREPFGTHRPSTYAKAAEEAKGCAVYWASQFATVAELEAA